MHRRTFVDTAAALAAAPRLAWGQEKRRIAIVVSSERVSGINTGANPDLGLMLEELESIGWIEGQNLIIERYSAEGEPDRYQELAETVVSTKPELIYANGLTSALMEATTTIPIVALAPYNSRDYVQSLERPGGNITGPATSTGPGLNRDSPYGTLPAR